MTASTQKYVYDIAEHLSRYVDVKILSTAIKWGDRESDGRVELIGLNDGSRFLFNKTSRFFSKYPPNNSVLVFWGYDFLNVIEMIALRCRFSCKIVSFIFDSHKPAISNYGKIKKGLANLYFALGKYLIRYFDGFMLFQESAVQKLKIKSKPYLVSKPGVCVKDDFPVSALKKNNIVTYAGTLSKLNGIDLLLDSIPRFFGENIIFRVFGNGPLRKQVEEVAERYTNLEYGGLLSESELLPILKSSSILLNLRCPNDEAMEYAFPSKVFEYINIGVPLLTTNIFEDIELSENTYILESNTVDLFVSGINDILDNWELSVKKACIAKEFVMKKYNYEILAKKMYLFLKEEVLEKRK